MERSEKIQIIFLVLIAALIFLMIFTISIFLKNKNLITQDPLKYGMQIHNFTSCSCIDGKGESWYSYEGGFINKNVEQLNLMPGTLE